MSPKGRMTKRKIKVLNRYKDTVCELLENRDISENADRMGHKEVIESESTEEGVCLVANEFPTLNESVRKKVTNVNGTDVNVAAENTVSQTPHVQLTKNITTVMSGAKAHSDSCVVNDDNSRNDRKATARMCEEGTGNIGFARVLVEIKATATQDFKDKVELCYKSKDQVVTCSKFVTVEYSWKPPRCSQCKVFRRNDGTCGMNVEVTA
ncbi:hypothetical protein CTI12_AA122440 [Artemisia annua]|uniref:Uncharacterized protein n=1 Tax=Artemisia annua TaxID=35608 RepID=A0A2U1PQ40_ARTAN|nr:hypothetical protein CTI12_AA122440 [Artemisia annua]